mmetsp:Transcript_2762/g.6175  ORF Transcript_2762/g.6175 Transcript_2762/m.6175 type:complete len:218 (-) Transcript_2762:1332-1985(-)
MTPILLSRITDSEQYFASSLLLKGRTRTYTRIFPFRSSMSLCSFLRMSCSRCRSLCSCALNFCVIFASASSPCTSRTNWSAWVALASASPTVRCRSCSCRLAEESSCAAWDLISARSLPRLSISASLERLIPSRCASASPSRLATSALVLLISCFSRSSDCFPTSSRARTCSACCSSLSRWLVARSCAAAFSLATISSLPVARFAIVPSSEVSRSLS